MATLPKVWSKFTATRNTDPVKFLTMELPKDRINDVIDLVLNYFAKEETFFKASGICDNEEAKAEYENFLLKFLTDGSIHTVVCCLENDSDEIGEIIGGSFITLTQKDSKDLPQPETKQMQKLIEMVLKLQEMYNICENLNVNTYYDGRGVVVHPKYRGYGIAQELFRTRRLICKEHNVPLTAALMTAYGSQKAAERDNWETVLEVNFEDFGKQLGVSFEGSPTTMKLMIARP